ncbi:hypothetical protein ACFQO4_05470 [Saliphagus sp. GCM10025334]
MSYSLLNSEVDLGRDHDLLGEHLHEVCPQADDTFDGEREDLITF